MLKIVEFIKANPSNWRELLAEEPYCVEVKEDDGFVLMKYSQIASDFSNPIVRECRGVILRADTYEPVCVPFFKFGNYGESYADKIDWSSAVVSEKIDGSIIKVWCFNGVWRVSTNVTIDARKASVYRGAGKYANFRELFDAAALNVNFDIATLNPKFTYIFEIVSPYNKIIVPYDVVELYHLGTRDNLTLAELDVDIGIKKPTVISCSNLKDLLKIVSTLRYCEEGYVVRDAAYSRIKVKSPAYVAASHLIEGVNDRRLIGLIRTGDESEFVSYFPEYASPVADLKSRLERLFEHVDGVIATKIAGVVYESRKAMAYVVTQELFPEFYFMCADGRYSDVREWMWQLPNDKIEYKLHQFEDKYGVISM